MAWSVIAFLVAASLGLAGHRLVASPAGRVVFHDEAAPWVTPPGPPTADLQQWGRAEAPEAVFRARFDVPDPARAELELRSFGDFEVSVNGARLDLVEGAGRPASFHRWHRVELGESLRLGPNEIAVTIRNLHGPPLLAVRPGPGGAPRLSTRDTWEVSVDGQALGAAVIASDVRGHPASLAAPRPLRALWSCLPYLVPVFLFAAWARHEISRRRSSTPGRARLLGLGAAAAAAALLFAGSFAGIDLATGFDAPHHVHYLDVVLAEWRVPVATEGWSTYHPPLFYFASAALYEAAEWLGAAGALGARLLPFLSGVGFAWLAYRLAIRLCPGDGCAPLRAALFAGFAPVNLTMAAYYSNEGMHGFLAAAALVVAADIVLRDRPANGWAGPIAFSVLAGLALLTKFTALVVVGPAAVVLIADSAVRYRKSPAVLASRLAMLVAPALLVAGWFYARNVMLYGSAIVGNWDLPEETMVWWSPPGFHTPGYYLRFGETLVHSFFSGFGSFWDSLYSTFWGDGFLGGRSGYGNRHDHWNYTAMAAGYLLALPATGLLVAGAVGALRSAWADAVGRRRAAFGLLLSICAAMGFAVFYATLSLPYHGQARASYLIAVIPVLGVFYARGAAAAERVLVRRAGEGAALLLTGYELALLALIYASFLG